MQAESVAQCKAFAAERETLLFHVEALLSCQKQLEHEVKVQKLTIEKEVKTSCDLSNEAEDAIMRTALAEFDAVAATEVSTAETRLLKLVELAERLVSSINQDGAGSDFESDEDEPSADSMENSAESVGGQKSRPHGAYRDSAKELDGGRGEADDYSRDASAAGRGGKHRGNFRTGSGMVYDL